MTLEDFRRFRADGWPLCPWCEEDELYSLADPPSIETITGCYRCQWTPERHRQATAIEAELSTFAETSIIGGVAPEQILASVRDTHRAFLEAALRRRGIAPAQRAELLESLTAEWNGDAIEIDVSDDCARALRLRELNPRRLPPV